jgi:hypothetical protein
MPLDDPENSFRIARELTPMGITRAVVQAHECAGVQAARQVITDVVGAKKNRSPDRAGENSAAVNARCNCIVRTTTMAMPTRPVGKRCRVPASAARVHFDQVNSVSLPSCCLDYELAMRATKNGRCLLNATVRGWILVYYSAVKSTSETPF